MFRDRTLHRMTRRLAHLERRFSRCLKAHDAARLFTGPSVYFHRKALARLRTHRSALDAIRDERYMDYLYATLTAWGLQRMGPGNARLLDLRSTRRSLLRNAASIRELEPLRLSDVPRNRIGEVTERVWTVLQSLEVSEAKAFLVANSKALHHVLPELVPPVDREYTLSFFFGSAVIDGREEEAFRVMFPGFHALARHKRAVIRRRVGRGPTYTSETKVIDNAIIGYWWRRSRAKRPRRVPRSPG